MNTKTERRMTYRFMSTLAVIVGVVGIALQLLPGWELLAFMLSTAVLGGLIGGRSGYDAAERQQLDGSYKTAFEWLLLIALFAYAFTVLSSWLPLGDLAAFLGGRWPGLMIAVMCAGIRKSVDLAWWPWIASRASS